MAKIPRTDWRPFTTVIDWSDGGPAIARWPDGSTKEFEVIVDENSDGEMEVDFDDENGNPAELSGAIEWRHMNLKNWIVATNQALLDAAAFGVGVVVLTNESTGLEVRRIDPVHVKGAKYD